MLINKINKSKKYFLCPFDLVFFVFFRNSYNMNIKHIQLFIDQKHESKGTNVAKYFKVYQNILQIITQPFFNEPDIWFP